MVGVDRYTIISEIYDHCLPSFKVRDRKNNRLITLCVLQKDGHLLERILYKHSLCKHIDHENLIKTYNIGSIDEKIIIETEYIQGETLYRKMAREGLIPAPIACKWIYEILLALECVWSLRLSHGNISPLCIMVDDKNVARLGGLEYSQAIMYGDDPWLTIYKVLSKIQCQNDLQIMKKDVLTLLTILVHLTEGTPLYASEKKEFIKQEVKGFIWIKLSTHLEKIFHGFPEAIKESNIMPGEKEINFEPLKHALLKRIPLLEQTSPQASHEDEIIARISANPIKTDQGEVKEEKKGTKINFRIEHIIPLSGILAILLAIFVVGPLLGRADKIGRAVHEALPLPQSKILKQEMRADLPDETPFFEPIPPAEEQKEGDKLSIILKKAKLLEQIGDYAGAVESLNSISPSYKIEDEKQRIIKKARQELAEKIQLAKRLAMAGFYESAIKILKDFESVAPTPQMRGRIKETLIEIGGR